MSDVDLTFAVSRPPWPPYCGCGHKASRHAHDADDHPCRVRGCTCEVYRGAES